MTEYGGTSTCRNIPHALIHFITINSIMTIAMVTPALIFISDKPPSPPSMIATKPRPV
jgi:hypothetical protein